MPPPCRSCGSAEGYFSDGLCEKCHPGGPLYPGSCRGCLAWGVYRAYCWLCWQCRWWQGHYPLGDCRYCGRNTWVGHLGGCRLCVEQARLLQQPGRALDLSEANRYGQQLFFANIGSHKARTPRLRVEPRRADAEEFTPSAWQQMTLFELAPDPEVVKARALVADHELLRYCEPIVREHAAKHGWSREHTNNVIRSLRLLQVLQETPGAKIKATDVLQLPRYGGNIMSTLDVLAVGGLLVEDRPSNVERYFAGKVATLPAAMRNELEIWLDVMLNGSRTSPRRHPRIPETTRIHIMGIAPIVQAWAAAGHQSLAEITLQQVRAALPKAGSRRIWAEYGLKSLFTVLKARKLLFINPTRGIGTTPVSRSIPLPLDTAAIRAALNSPDPAIALAVALVAFHAVTSKELQELRLTDIIDGRLTLHGRVIPLGDPVRVRLTAWLDHRARTWPGSINPHLFVSRRSAPRFVPVGRQFPWRNTSLRPQALREDRILQEIIATDGDVRRICDLFGLSINAALRYSATVDHSELAERRSWSPRTQDSTYPVHDARSPEFTVVDP